MVPASFEQSNALLDLPPDAQDKDIEPLSVWQGVQSNGVPAMVSCWKLTADELTEVNRTGRVWLVVMGYSQPPLAVEGVCPIRASKGGSVT